jgi:hypothetical protein
MHVEQTSGLTDLETCLDDDLQQLYFDVIVDELSRHRLKSAKLSQLLSLF